MNIISAIRRRLSLPVGTVEGYEADELVDVVFRKTKAYRPTGSWAEIARAHTVLDFGGGCGIHYKRARLTVPDVKWAVVETPAMAARGSELATDSLRFFTSIDAARDWLGSIDVMHSNSALQYSPNPSETLNALCALRAQRMLWDRLFLSDGATFKETQTSNLIDNGPGAAPRGVSNKMVKYERTAIPRSEFLAAHRDYRLLANEGEKFEFALKSQRSIS